MEGTREVHNSVVLKLTSSCKNIARFATATKLPEDNDKKGTSLNQWTVFLAENQTPNQHWSSTRCQAVPKRLKLSDLTWCLWQCGWCLIRIPLQWWWKRYSNSQRKEQTRKDNRHKPSEESKHCKQRRDRTCFYPAFYLNKRSGIY